MYCENLLKNLSLDKSLELHNCDLLAEINLEIPFYEKFGFPPALIPIASSASSFSYTGVYLHDINFNKLSFVNFLIEESEMYEIGLTESQFSYYLARVALLDYYEEEDEDISLKIERLCAVLGILDFEKLKSLTDDEFIELNIFNQGVPKYLVDRKAGCIIGNTGFQQSSIGNYPDRDLLVSFDESIDLEDYQNAWQILNSPGWRLNDALTKFKTLADKVDCEWFTMLHNEWVNIEHPLDGY